MAAGATATLRTGDLSLSYAPLGSVDNVERLPYSLRILLENALRFESESGVEAVAQWEPQAEPSRELGFRPSRVLLQDFTGVPRSSTSPRCAARWPTSAATRRRSTRTSRPSS
jgi:aconitate hydratase